jgi:signal transduction histidine kinase
MFEPYAIASSIIAISLLLLGLGAVLRSPQAVLNRIFFLFCVSIGVWMVSNYLASASSTSYELALASNKLVLLAGITTLGLIAEFLLRLTKIKIQKPVKRTMVAGLLLTSILCATNLVVSDIRINEPTWDIVFGPLAPVYFLMLLATAAGVIGLLLKALLTTKGTVRAQVNSIFYSAVLVVPVVLFTNALLPFAFNYYHLTQAGALTGVVVVLGMANVIFRHKLFDIRAAIVRSLGYVLAVGTILVIYAVIAQSLTTFLEQRFGSESWSGIVNIVLIVILVLAYQPLKRRFDKLSNKIFYRDAYDSQDLFNDINNVVISNVDVAPLLSKSTEIINHHMKTSFCTVELRATAYNPLRLIGDKHGIPEEDSLIIRTLVAPMKSRVMVTETLQESNPRLYNILNKHDVAAVSKMASSIDYGLEGIGLIFFGFKKSGNSLTVQDSDAIDIISSELTIATQNALRFEEIENFNVTLQEKVDDATKRLKKANEKLKIMDETKDEFISMASHQLRTPLTSVKGYVSMVLEGDAGPLNDMQKKLLEQSFVSSQRMVYLIADLLNLSRLKTGKFVIENVSCNLADVIEGEVEQLKETAAGKNMTLIYNRPKTFPTLMLDETKIRQVIMNFVDNAIYYTPAGGKIEINLVEKSSSIEFTVKDNGIGVPEAEQHHLFNKFYRAKNAQKARPDGTGLGLFMAKKVIVAQGGALIFSSTVGKGSTFGFSFVKSKLKPEPTPEPVSTETVAAK